MNSYCSIGLKVLAAVGVGAAVFFGLDKVISGKKSSQPKEEEPRVKQSEQSNQQNFQQDSWDSGNNNDNNHQPRSIEVAKPTNKVEKVVDGLRTAQDICGRAFSLCQSLVMVVDNVSNIFNKNSNINCGNGPGGWNNPGGRFNQQGQSSNGYQDKYKDPPGFTRISPFILACNV